MKSEVKGKNWWNNIVYFSRITKIIELYVFILQYVRWSLKIAKITAQPLNIYDPGLQNQSYVARVYLKQ